jgi:hypothetical protein
MRHCLAKSMPGNSRTTETSTKPSQIATRMLSTMVSKTTISSSTWKSKESSAATKEPSARKWHGSKFTSISLTQRMLSISEQITILNSMLNGQGYFTINGIIIIYLYIIIYILYYIYYIQYIYSIQYIIYNIYYIYNI